MAIRDGGVANDQTFADCANKCATTPKANVLNACLRTKIRADGATGNHCSTECFSGD